MSKSVGFGKTNTTAATTIAGKKKLGPKKTSLGMSQKSKSSAADDYTEDEFESMSMSKSMTTSMPLTAGKKNQMVQCPKCLQFLPKAKSKSHINSCKVKSEKGKYTNYTPIKEENPADKSKSSESETYTELS